jgi:light-regulated signal transduction histidine kinase (bacteriophytochrome)
MASKKDKEIEKLRADCLALEEQVKLLVVTELKLRRTQAELIESKEKIVEYSRTLEQKVEERTIKLNEAVRDLEAFAYSVSHDLRAPIRHIDGFVKLLFAKIPQPDELIGEYYNKILASTQRMSVMIDSLLAFSRLGRKELKITLIDLESLVGDVINLFKPDLEERTIQWKVSSLPKIYGDQVLMQLVYENVISNALKYTSKKEIALIEIGSVSETEKEYELFVKDNGVGFDMAYSDKLFNVFQRLHNADSFEGIGIGLANVKQIIEKHKGSVRAEGKPDEGATFYFTLPKTGP